MISQMNNTDIVLQLLIFLPDSEVFGRSKSTEIFPVRQVDPIESTMRSKTRSDTIIGPIV